MQSGSWYANDLWRHKQAGSCKSQRVSNTGLHFSRQAVCRWRHWRLTFPLFLISTHKLFEFLMSETSVTCKQRRSSLVEITVFMWVFVGFFLQSALKHLSLKLRELHCVWSSSCAGFLVWDRYLILDMTQTDLTFQKGRANRQRQWQTLWFLCYEINENEARMY